jgi:hypothetical protein
MNNELFLQSQIACAYIELEAMKAENESRKIKNQSPAYTEQHFLELIGKYGLGHNTVITELTK